MPFTLDSVVPWGRSLAEYVAMFALDATDLDKKILGCSDGPASFNALATRRGHRVISIDPIYQFSAAQIARRIEQTSATIAEQTRHNSSEFVWTHFQSVEELIEARMSAMRVFLQDLPEGQREGRYVQGGLPELPFADRQFELALCSHFLFLYSEQFDADFHTRSILELCRAAGEVRIFPLLELGARPSRHLEQVVEALGARGFRVSRMRVGYEFQRGGNEMLRVVPA